MKELNKQCLLIAGAGGHAKVLADCALSLGWKDIAFIDDTYPDVSCINNWPIIGKIEFTFDLAKKYPYIVLGVGNNQLRRLWFEVAKSKGFKFPSLIHPTSFVSKFAEIGEATVVLANAVVNIDAKVKTGCIINTSSIIEHDAVIESFCHIAPKACIAGGAHIGGLSWIGVGVNILQQEIVKENSVIKPVSLLGK